MAGRSRLTIRAPLYAVRNSSRQKKDLTRRANHRQISIIARILKPAPEKPAAGFFHLNFPNRAVAAATILPTRALVARRHCALPPELLLAGTRTPVNCLCTKYAEIILDRQDWGPRKIGTE